MSITGEKKGLPTKIGVGVSDIITGLYATISILSALRFRDQTSLGQYLDISLLDSQVSWLSYVAQSYLISGKIPDRIGNDHPSIVPYQTVKAKDGLMVLAIANDRQFKNFCEFSGLYDLCENSKFKSNSSRVKNRKELNKIIGKTILKKTITEWVQGLTKINVPCGPINNIKQVFDDPQVKSRKMKINMKHKKSKTGKINIVGSPMNFSVSKIRYKKTPPTLGEDTQKFLNKFLKISIPEIKKLKDEYNVNFVKYPKDLLKILNQRSDEVVRDYANKDKLGKKILDSIITYRKLFIFWSDYSEKSFLESRV